MSSPEALRRGLSGHGYIVDDALAMSVYLALRMQRPLFVEGAPGVGKTMLARVLADALGVELVRLQCHEGLDLAQAAYEWNYPRQLLELQARGGDAASLYREDMLLRRPLLQAIDASRTQAPVLLIDEIDRADEEFESFLLELLAEFQITIPELGTIRAIKRPIVIVTSNRTRDVHDALKRRCLYHWIDYPTAATELAIVRARVPQLADRLAAQVVAFVQRVRREDLAKVPGIAESVDWAEAIALLDLPALAAPAVKATLGLLFKYHDDLDRIRASLEPLLAEAV
ncbi:MAG TPA: MoxR family ATPase [Kofleriaceae bacterium]|nr:MoxR family ATPase [Kofleriaceae bacterium]